MNQIEFYATEMRRFKLIKINPSGGIYFELKGLKSSFKALNGDRNFTDKGIPLTPSSIVLRQWLIGSNN